MCGLSFELLCKRHISCKKKKSCTWAVGNKGGYEWVSDNGLWGLVAEECGLDVGVKTCLKLIYFKYLRQLVQWLIGILQNGNLDKWNGESHENLDSLLEGLGTEFRGLILGGMGPKERDDGVFELESEKSDKNILNLSIALRRAEKVSNDGDDQNYGDDIVNQDSIIAKRSYFSRKRKRDYLSGVLSWVREIAKHPEGCNGNRNGNEVFSTEVLRVRESLLIRMKVCTKEESLLQKLKIQTSMYEDNIDVNHHSAEMSRCSRRFSSVKSRLCSCSAAQSKLSGPQRTMLESWPKDQALTPHNQESENTNASEDLFLDDLFPKPIPVGPNFQAEIPKWAGEVIKSDSKWLGEKVWPLENGGCSFQIEKDFVGRGKSDCRFPGSVECIRFHIAEKRMKLKLDLGTLFYHWRFDQMGEEISLAWTTEEEKRFKHKVRSNFSLQSPSFWDNALRIFPTRTRENLVRYYFNVLLIRRRIYQNRVTPRKVDSDDDELEF